MYTIIYTYIIVRVDKCVLQQSCMTVARLYKVKYNTREIIYSKRREEKRAEKGKKGRHEGKGQFETWTRKDESTHRMTTLDTQERRRKA